MARTLPVSILGLFLLLTFPACKSIEPHLFKVPAAGLRSRLPGLQVTVEAPLLADRDGALPEDVQKQFQMEIIRNVTLQTDTSLYGYARLTLKDAQTSRTGRGFQALQLMTLMTPSILGVPLEYYHTSLRAEVEIIDSQGQLVGVYSGLGESTVPVAMYYGYSQQKAPRLADMLALQMALDNIRPLLVADAPYLNERLVAGGPIAELGAELGN
ncbi:hypothetical protein LJY25_16875 [Hymenobacter sp. BT175]|uniref:hypothetical protein n=1 Tax=Hymenobacter translucens TaxID=2886507 RepID=UPI001D0DCD5F|nr:hypothetical protein [Hymenobacter translucens]MCC2548126.1 hypothetical protein [Hymenobacter translucens]